MQEGHSFDNYFGTYPGADGIPKGTCMPVDPARRGGRCVAPFRLGDRSASLPHSARRRPPRSRTAAGWTAS